MAGSSSLLQLRGSPKPLPGPGRHPTTRASPAAAGYVTEVGNQHHRRGRFDWLVELFYARARPGPTTPVLEAGPWRNNARSGRPGLAARARRRRSGTTRARLRGAGQRGVVPWRPTTAAPWPARAVRGNRPCGVRAAPAQYLWARTSAPATERAGGWAGGGAGHGGLGTRYPRRTFTGIPVGAGGRVTPPRGGRRGCSRAWAGRGSTARRAAEAVSARYRARSARAEPDPAHRALYDDLVRALPGPLLGSRVARMEA